MHQQIFVKVLERCHNYAQAWSLLRKDSGNAWQHLPESIAHEVEVGLLNFSWLQYSLVRFSTILNACQRCNGHSLAGIVYDLLEEEEQESASGSTDVSSEHEGAPPTTGLPKGLSLPNEEFTTALKQPSVAFSEEDDHYKSAPIAVRRAQAADKTIWVFDVDGLQVLPGCWSFWKDQGYRIHSTFFRTLPLEGPSIPADSGLALFSEPTTSAAVSPQSLLDERTLAFSAREFIDEAGTRTGTDGSKRVFLLGKERERGTPENPSKFLALDLEKDAVDISPDEIEISVDIDSLIWVTSATHFKLNSFTLLLVPFGEPTTAFATNNFVYVNLVAPPANSYEVRNPATRSLENVRLSRIPYVDFGHIGEGERRINFYIFFPRLIRKHEKNGRYVTMLPFPVKELWFDKVILPSCNQVFKKEPGFTEYISPNIAEIRNRTGDRKRHMPIIGKDRTMDLLKLMQQKILDDLDLLSCFGSFFIVADGRGMKLATKQCVHSNVSKRSLDFKLIQEEFPQLDWDQMLDRRKGELYLDLGISYHALTEEPLVGLWRLRMLRESFNTLGTKKGKVHHFNAFANLGGIKAEMKRSRKEELHIISRLSYCLPFELIRNPGRGEYLCGDKDAIQRSEKFLQACKKWESLLYSGTTRSFGVRDEIRGLAGAILQLLPTVADQVSTAVL